MKLIPKDAAFRTGRVFTLVRTVGPPGVDPNWRKMVGPLGQGVPEAVTGPAVDIIIGL